MTDEISLKEHLLALRAGDLKALKLQAAEYARRLEELNHAHARAEEKAHTYVTLDKYEDYNKQQATALKLATEAIDLKFYSLETQLKERIEGLALFSAGAEGQRDGVKNLWVYLVGAAGVLTGIVGLALALLR